MKNKKPICHNCKHRGEYFKVFRNNHHHCNHPKWKEEDFISGKHCAWDTLCEWWDTCKDYEAKETLTQQGTALKL